MKKLLIACAAFVCLSQVHAQAAPDLQVENRLIGSGEQVIPQNAPRYTNAKPVGDYGVYHVPQFLPYHPTSATLWPRVIDVRCEGQKCQGFDWTPDMGRSEYVYFRPVQVKVAAVQPPPVIVAAPVVDKKINE